MELNKGDLCLLRGSGGFDVCVRVLKRIDAWEGAQRFLGEKLSATDGRVIVRRAFFADDVLKIISRRGEFGLSRPDAVGVN